MSYWAVSDVDPNDLWKFAELMRARYRIRSVVATSAADSLPTQDFAVFELVVAQGRRPFP